VTEDKTVLLADMKNFSRVVSAAPMALIDVAMKEYYREAEKIIVARGGVFEKFLGDGTIGVFEVAKSCQAIACAWDLIGLGQRSAQKILRRVRGEVVTGTRVGIATGPISTVPREVVCPHCAKDLDVHEIVSDVVNIAARLEAAAPVNGVLIDHETVVAIQDSGDDSCLNGAVEELLGIEVMKGQPDPCKAWRLVARTREETAR